MFDFVDMEQVRSRSSNTPGAGADGYIGFGMIDFRISST
jgi:hypothetical protein